jgi:transposase
MFIKVTQSGKYKYCQVVKSHRENGKVKHTVLFNLGRLDEIEGSASFANMGWRLLELSKAKSAKNLEDISEAEISSWGYIPYKRLWEKFKLPQILKSVSRDRKISYNLSDTSFLMAASHLLGPKSKLGTYQNQNRYIGLDRLSLNDIYRSLDILAERKEEIEERLFDINLNLFNMSVDVLFYDVTTFSFSSVRADSLKDFGFSKEGKPAKVQVVLGLLIDLWGRPVGYNLFSGNTFDGKTLEKALESLKGRFGIRDVIIVADRGINSKANLKSVSDKGYSYIFSYRLKSAPKKIKDMLSGGGFSSYGDGQDRLSYKVTGYKNRVKYKEKEYELDEKLIITYSEARAGKDRSDRERAVEKAEALLLDKARVKAQSKRGYRKYLKDINDNNPSWVLDRDKIEAEGTYDGYYAIETNKLDIGPEDAIDAYHNLWKIEESFRIMKSTLEVKPIFHWTEKRIKGHFVICFLAFMLERELEFRLRKADIPFSPEKIKDALNSLNFARVDIEGKTYLIKTRAASLANKILRLLKIKPPKNICSIDELNL